jgi:hypothetical protein
MALRNEPRPNLNPNNTAEPYNWDVWYKHNIDGAKAVSDVDSRYVIYLSGIQGGVDFTRVVDQSVFESGSKSFSRDDFGASASKLVLELHYYNQLDQDKNCSNTQARLLRNGFGAANATGDTQFAVVMGEFGFEQTATSWQDWLPACIEGFVPANAAGWMIWPLMGSYYVRQGKQDSDETWGLLTHDWSDWRSPEHIENGLKPMIRRTMAAAGGTQGNGTGGDGGGGGGGGGSGRGQNGQSRLVPELWWMPTMLIGWFYVTLGAAH